MARLSFLLCCCILFLSSVFVANGDEVVIDMPTGSFNFTTIDSGDKNSGLLLSEDSDEGYICIGSTAKSKGIHLGSAAQTIEDDAPGTQSAAAVQVLLANQATSASQNLLQTQSTGQSLWTQALYPFLQYFNGTVMSQLSVTKPFNVYLIFYGKLWTASEKKVVLNFVESITPAVKSASINDRTIENWWKINTKYYHDSRGRSLTSDVLIKDAYQDSGSVFPRGSASNPLNDKDIRGIIRNALTKKFGTPNTRSVYAVLTDSSTYVQDFCEQMCTYHSSFRAMNKTVAYIFAGNPATQCPKYCSYQYFDSMYKAANGLGVDATVNWLAHGLAGVATNPFQARKGNKGWVVADSTIDNADMCEWDFGYIGFTKDYATWNLKGNGDMRFLIQRNWNRKLGRCTIIANDKPDSQLPATPS